MKGPIVAVAVLLAGPIQGAQAQSAAPPLNSAAARSFADFQNFGPHRAFVLSPQGKPIWWAGTGGPDPGGVIAMALKRCADQRPVGALL